jgi:uncharacterized protein (DUF2141 family)
MVKFIVLSLLAASSFAQEPSLGLRSIVTGADPGVGQIKASLFSSAENYLQEPLVELVEPVDAQGHATLDFGKHPPGEYAVVVFFDRNANGELDTGMLGIPKEKIGFSNNARGRFGPAKWDSARFVLVDTDHEAHIQLGNAK